ncbi:MAG: hypothetical protein HYW69_00695, partial [Candidatus Nealsonbacteria bacterium]|nr:hypothetical protein [Candidatus Nealsonbacteria bacterium]
LEKNHYYDNDGKLIGLDYRGLDRLSISLVPEGLVRELRCRLPDVVFSLYQEDGSRIVRDFLGGQFVAYISRIWRGHAMGGLQAAEHMRNTKIPEEMRELIEALIKSSDNLTGHNLIEDVKLNLSLANDLVNFTQYVIGHGDASLLLAHLAVIINKKIKKPVTVEDTLHLMFLKMKGRQELDFMGVPEQTMRYICKPAEYLIEADMFF